MKRSSTKFFIEIIMIIFGTIIMGFSFSVFLEPNNISTGGFSGLSMIINVIFTNFGITFLSTSMIYLILNLGLYFYALKKLGKKFAIKALIGISSFSIGMEIFKLINLNIQYERLISAIYGGAIMGIGIGIVIRFGGSTGGSDMIACIIKNKNPKISIGAVMVFIDFSVIILSLFVFSNGSKILPYTILALLLSMFITDYVSDGYKQIRAFHIVTTKPNEISNELMSRLSRGCTCVNVTGMHTKSDRYIIICLISKYQVNHLKTIINEIDKSAFVYSTKVSELIGLWSENDNDSLKIEDVEENNSLNEINNNSNN